MKMVNYKKKLFGKEIEIIIWDTKENLANNIIEEAYIEGLRLQKIFNFFDEKSTLSLLNKKRKLKVPVEFLEVLNKSLEMCKKTNGLYDISLGKQFLQRKKALNITKVECSYKDIRINSNEVELLHTDVLIDLGSIAKGYITDKMIDFLKSQGIVSGLIDARGDIRIFGKYNNIIEVQHPRDKNKSICAIKLKNSGVATSGDYNQYHENFDNCHIINKKDYISVTAIAPNLTEADLFATSIFVTPKEDIDKILTKKKVKLLCIDKNLKIEKYNKFDEVIYQE